MRHLFSPPVSAKKLHQKFPSARRLNRLRAALEGAGLRAGLLTDPNDVFYYTGYRPTAPAFLVVSRSRATLYAYGVDNAAARIRSSEVRFISSLKAVALPRGRIGYDQAALTAAAYFALRRRGRQLVPALKALSLPRQRKEPGELALMRAALRIALRAHQATRIAGTERSVAAAFDAKLRVAGAEPSFDTIVGAGPNSGDIHHRPTAQRISLPVVFDFGARWKGYCSDTTRTRIGPERWQRALFETVEQMQGGLIDFIQPGMAWKSVQAEWARQMKRAKHAVSHGFGHGIGLAVHEPLPTLLPGSVVTVEPGIYTRRGGCRIEDMVLITKNGARILTR